MVREDLITSAVSFLQDPSVVTSPLDKRIAFLRSKNLTQEEIDVALSRAGDSSQPPNNTPAPPPPSYGYPSQQMTRQPNGYGYGYGYGPYPSGPWSQPLQPPRRDWRDYFILATLTSTLSYTLYFLSKRYILPLLRPPTPPQLETDKSAIDASFARAFALIDQLAADTAAIKKSEEERTERLDKAIRDVNDAVEGLREMGRRRERDGELLKEQVLAIKAAVPRAMEAWKAQGEGEVEELGGEVKSLKKLLQTRVAGSVNGTATSSSGHLNPSVSPSRMGSSSGAADRTNSQERRSSGAYTTADTAGLGGKVAAGKASYEGSEMAEKMAPAPGVTVPRREGSSSGSGSGSGSGIGFSRGGGRAAIPAWQMAASGKGGGEGSSAEGAS